MVRRLSLFGSVVSLILVCANSIFAQANNRDLKLRQIKEVSEWPASPKRFALIIGIDDYQDTQINRLDGASNDAKALADVLARYAGFPSDQVSLLTTDQPTERKPTKGNILRRLSNLRTVVPKDGLLLVAFAGHGMAREGRAYLLPMDAQVSDDIALLEDTAINVDSMRDRIRRTEVRQVVMIIDACRNDPAAGRAAADSQLTAAYTRAFSFDVRNQDIQAFATLYSTEVGNRAYEFKEKKQGYFTWALVQGIKGAAANAKGEITLASLIKYLQDVVPKRIGLDLGAGKRQRPWADIEGYKADELVIAVAGRTTSDTMGDLDEKPTSVTSNTGSSGVAKKPAKSDNSSARPDSKSESTAPATVSFKTYSPPNGQYQLSYPATWRVHSQNDLNAEFAPDWAVKGKELTHGAIVGYSSLHNRSLSDAVDTITAQLRQSNQGLREESSKRSSRRIGGRDTLETFLVRKTTAGYVERIWMTVRLSGEGVIYLLFVAPEREFQRYQASFESILDSLSVADKQVPTGVGSGSQSGSMPPKAPIYSPQRVESNFFTFELQQCRISGSVVACDLVITNKENDRELSLVGRSTMIDNFGNSYIVSDVQLANGVGRLAMTTLVKDIPTRGKLTFRNVSLQAEKIALLKVESRLSRAGVVEASFRDIPLSR